MSVSWRQVLVALAVIGLACAPVSWFDEGITPSWVVYPLFLLAGLYRLRKGGTAGTVWLGVSALVFLIVHLPWSYAALFGDEHPLDEDLEFSPVQWFATLFVIPLATLVVAGFAHREARRAAPSADA